MPVYNVKLSGDAWAELIATVEAEDESAAIDKARTTGDWRIVGDVKPVTSTAKPDEGKSGDRSTE